MSGWFRRHDPGWRAHQFFLGGFVYLRAGRIADVPRFADEFDRLVPLLTPHDEMHAVALRSVLESSRGYWPALRELTARAEAANDANVETPCQFNWRSLLVCALGLAHLGEELAARRLEERACAGAVVAGPPEREPALLRLALLRGDLETAERILERLPTGVDPWGLDATAARLDALAALGDRARVEAEAASFWRRRATPTPSRCAPSGSSADGGRSSNRPPRRSKRSGSNGRRARRRRSDTAHARGVPTRAGKRDPLGSK